MELCFYLNGEKKRDIVEDNISLLDYLRDKLYLRGPKKGCGEGDCGACTVLIGEYYDNKWHYKHLNSCIYPIYKIDGKSIITIEGLSKTKEVRKIEKILLKYGAVQCGFCSPGFVVSIVAYFLNAKKPNIESFKNHLTGNLCRCTGYKPFIDAYFELEKSFSIPSILKKDYPYIKRKKIYDFNTRIFVPESFDEVFDFIKEREICFVSGWSDFFIRKRQCEYLVDLSYIEELKRIEYKNGILKIGVSVPISNIMSFVENIFPAFYNCLLLMASPQIRNIATISGNIENASPIADSVVFLSSADARVNLRSYNGERDVLLREYYKDYKKTKRKGNEFIESVEVDVQKIEWIDFVKISKRKNVDIASVNSSIAFFNNKLIWAIGGVKPYVVSYEFEKNISEKTMYERVLSDIAPISDVRGSADFRKTAVANALKKHFENRKRSENESV